MRNLIIALLCTFTLMGAHLQAQIDAGIKLSYADGKDRLLSQNLNLLAEYYNIEIAQAEIEQAVADKAEAKAAIADRLGLTQDELAILLG